MNARPVPPVGARVRHVHHQWATALATGTADVTAVTPRPGYSALTVQLDSGEVQTWPSDAVHVVAAVALVAVA